MSKFDKIMEMAEQARKDHEAGLTEELKVYTVQFAVWSYSGFEILKKYNLEHQQIVNLFSFEMYNLVDSFVEEGLYVLIKKTSPDNYLVAVDNTPFRQR